MNAREQHRATSDGRIAEAPVPRSAVPFDTDLLDELMRQAGIDLLVVSSKHNIQYLLGGYRFFFFDHFDAIGVSRYLPLLVSIPGATPSVRPISETRWNPTSRS